jgi:DNA-binding LacI/PurR family transcriptional regulator
MNDILNRRVQGVLSVGLEQEVADWIDAQHIPNVAFAGPGRYIVVLDGAEVVRLGVRHLARSGCRKIALWRAMAPRRPFSSASDPDKEFEAFQETLQECGLPLLPGFYRHGREFSAGAEQPVMQSHQEQGYSIALDVFGASGKPRPDGIVIADDMMTHGALLALGKMGLRGGREVQIATHANRGSMVLLGREDELTLIEMDPAEVVQAMFNMLETLMAGRKPRARSVVIAPRIRE